MRKRIAAVVLPAALIAALLTACAPQRGEAASFTVTDFAGKDVAVITGVLTVNTTRLIGGNPIEYNDSAAAAEDVRQGRVAGYMHALTAVQVMAAQMEGFEVVPIPKDIFAAQVAGFSLDPEVIRRFNVFLKAARADGTLADMESRWFGNGMDLDAPRPEIPNGGENGVITVATCADSIPYVFAGAGGELSGFSVELALRFGAHEGKRIEFIDMAFGGLVPYIASGKATIGMANMAVTEERKESVLFTDPYFDEGHGILVLAEDAERLPVYSDFFGKTIGIPTGYIFDVLIENEFDGTVAYYTEPSAGIEDMRQGRIAGFMTDLSGARVIVNEPGNENLLAVAVPDTLFSGPLGAITHSQDIADRFNAFLTELEADGTLAAIRRYWLEDTPGSDPPMPDIPLSGKNGTLTAAVGASSIPFTYIGGDGEMKGLCIELLYRFAAREGKSLELVSMEFGALVNYISSEKADLGVDAITITEERKKSVLFTDPFYFDHAGIIALRPEPAAASGAAEWLKTGIERNLLTDNRWKLIVSGLGVTMIISFAAQFLGTVVGGFVCWLLTRKNRFVRWLGSLYCGLIHGTPIVVLLMITYYIIFGGSDISNVLIAVAAFTMITGAGIAVNLKGAMETVDPVEIEAARSIGFSAFKAFTAVTLPQAVRRALPGYTGGFVELVKATAIVGYIAIQDLTRAGDIIRSRTYDAYFPLLFVAVIYLIVTTICVQTFKRIVQKVNRGEGK
jgi:polar amino acid transport system substrate-binding protein